MSLRMVVIPFLLLTTAVERGISINVGYVTLPLFEMLCKDLPQNEDDTANDYVGINDQETADIGAYFAKVKTIDVKRVNSDLSLNVILDDKTSTIIKDARVMFNRDTLKTENLVGYNCTSFCYNVSVPMILNATGWTEDRLDGKIEPSVRLLDIHEAIVKVIEDRFCCNMTEIAVRLNMDPVEGVKQTAVYISVWEKFVPRVNEATIQCKADELRVTTSELAELLRTNLAILLSYDLNQMDLHFFPAYEDLLRRKNLFETVGIIPGVVVTLPNWSSGTMARFAEIVSQFSPRDLQILYRWEAPQLFAIQNIPMSIFQVACSTVSTSDPLFTVSQTLFGFQNNLPSCDIAFLLSRSFNEVNTKFSVSLPGQNALEIYRGALNPTPDWFSFYQVLQLSIDEGIWVETPTLNQVAQFRSTSLNTYTTVNSIPMAISDIKDFNTSSTLNTIMRTNYNSFLNTLLNTYGYTSAQLAVAAGITETQLLTSRTIQQAHSLLVDSIEARYRISDLVSLLGVSGVDAHVLFNLPSFEWFRVVRPAIQNAFAQSADAFSVQLSNGGVQIATIEGSFPTIQVSSSVIYHTDRVSPTELATCINRELSVIHAMTLTEYHQLHINSIVPLLRIKMMYETQSMQSLLNSRVIDFEDVKSNSVAQVIFQLTGVTSANLQCLYGWSTNFINTDLAISFQTANETRLCNDFLDRTLFEIVAIISQTESKICFLCTTDPCGNNTMCRDIPGSFECTCNIGYESQQNPIRSCVDIPECARNLHNCDENASCDETPGSFECTCDEGFTGNGRTCEDINECAIDPNRCGDHGVCTNTVGSFSCGCETGYRWNGTACNDIDECQEDSDNCHTFAICDNTVGSFLCNCLTGFFGNGVQCEDIKECDFQAGAFPCHVRADCTDVPGTYTCTCKEGYSGNGLTCTDINECDINSHDCHSNATCRNTIPGFSCECNGGFEGNGETCTDVNECDQNLDNCHINANCINTIGSFTCDCKDGFNGNGTYCYVAEVSFERSQVTINEGERVQVTVILNGEIDTVSVIRIVVTGTATEIADFNAFSETMLFTVGGSSTQTFDIVTIDDQRLEGLETITLTLSSLQNHVTPGDIPSMTINIIDNDAITVGFSQELYTVNEGSNDDFANLIVAIQSGIVDKEIAVSFQTIPGSALLNQDFTFHTQEIQFGPGNAGPKIVRVPLVNNDRTESDEQFTAVLTTTDSDVNIARSPATVTIVDDDVATVRLEESSYSVDEGSSTITATLIVDGERDIVLAARLNSEDISAEGGKDYVSIVNQDINILPSQDRVSFIISIISDTIVEHDETFSITLTSRSLPHLVVVNHTSTQITIRDNDDVSVEFSQSSYSTDENTAPVNVRVIVLGSFEKTLRLSVSTSDRTATAAVDYQQLDQTISFVPGDSSEKNVPIQIFEDDLVENTETFSVEMTTSDTDILFPNGRTATVSITDDDDASVRILSAQYTFDESDPVTRIPLFLTGNLAIPVSVRFSTISEGDANWPLDFALISNLEIVFRPGEPATQLVSLDIKDDNVVENMESFSVVLSSASNKVTIGTFNSSIVHITDNDVLEVHFSSSHYEADEDSGFALVGIVLKNVLEISKNVRLVPSNGTATEPEDFPLIHYDVTLEAGQPRTVYQRINITNDMLEEYSEHFFLTLVAIDGNVQIVQPQRANITIGESDDIFFCDPTALQYPCHIKADCIDVPGSFRCTCVEGYEGNGLRCTNINECNTIECPFNATCEDTEGSYRCICLDGFVGDGVNCRDINECAEGTHLCHEQATCRNTLGSYDCECNPGWTGNGRTCSNVDECSDDSLNECHDYANCTDTLGSYTCMCKTGFTGDGRMCRDIDECRDNVANCHAQARCGNTRGSFECTCNEGWTGNGRICTNINECDLDLNDCHDYANCLDTEGSYRCVCKPGFTGNGRQCDDINECQMDTDNCPDNSICNNTRGNFTCTCNLGFIHQGSICVDVNECTDGSDNCHTDADCVNMPGSFDCHCKDGFTGNGRNCINVDECTMNPNPCDVNANCTDTQGSFNCTCHPGYVGNGLQCEDFINCILLPLQYPCDVRANCTDVAGGFTCTCPHGFTLADDDRNCDDVDECAAMTFTCHANASCHNVDGSYECRCNPGFVGDGVTNCIDTTCSSGNPCSPYADCSVNVTSASFTCVCRTGFTGDGFSCNDIDECQIPGSCGANANCTNLPEGSHTCICKAGFTGNPLIVCEDIDECENDPCHPNATCDNQDGGYDCNCKAGFSGDGFNSCNDINECGIEGTCDENADCVNSVGSHECTCHSGFTGNGKSCMDIDECNDPSNCPANSDCSNSAGSFSCQCKTGFREVGDLCEDIDECDGDPCEEDGAVCRNTPGSFTCTCPEDLYNNGNFCYVFCPFKLDLAFIVDTSDSISGADFVHVKNFMTEAIGRMEISETGNHVAAISFGSTVDVFMRFNNVTGADLNRRNLIERFNDFPQTGGLTRIDLALLFAESSVFTESDGMRTDNDIRKVAVVITDGEQTMGPGVPREPLSDIARRLQSKDITVLAVGVGTDVPRNQLLNITNSIEENILQVNSYENLVSIINQFINTSCTDVNECELYDACHENANCIDTLGAYSCFCKPGYQGDGFDCQDVNECDGVNECDANANCQNTDGSHECACRNGYTGSGRQCQDIDECDLETDNCHDSAVCNNTQGAFTCVCLEGYSGDGVTLCNDIDECRTGDDNCHTESRCDNNAGSFTCTCNEGYSGNGVDCQDIDECIMDQDDCSRQASCSNIAGSFTCTCNQGYSGDGKTCSASDCPINCSDDAICMKNGSDFQCVCNSGFSGDGATCADIDECTENTDNCHAQATCTNIAGGFECGCNSGWTGNGNECTNINECQTGNNDCHENADCIDNDGNYTCACQTGFSGDGRQCGDINECNGINDCDQNANCTNNEGSYTCQCREGYTGNGRVCTDTRCGGLCDANADCVPDGQNFVCACKTGYSGDGISSCTDDNECAGNNSCATNATCSNTQGSFMCSCNTGYSGDGRTCNDINECNGQNDCHSNADCINNEGSYSCQCRNGYSGDGLACTNINECNNVNNCDSNADCSDNDGGFTCECRTGFTGDGVTCSVVPGCENCTTNSECVNIEGVNTCQCRSGFSNNVGTTQCADINECAQSSTCRGDQACRNYPGTHQCFCTSPGKYLHNGTCVDVSSVVILLRILNEIFVDELASANTAGFFTFSQRLEDRVNRLLEAIYSPHFIDSTVLTFSNGSVVASVLLVFQRGQAPSENDLNQAFFNNLNTTNNMKMLNTFVIAQSSDNVQDYNECDPTLPEHTLDCPQHSLCENSYGSFSCVCTKGYEKHSKEHDFCVSESDDDWWFVYAVVFAAVGFVVLVLIFLFCFLECRGSEELYRLHDEARPHDKRIDQEVAPGFPGSVPRTTSNSSQMLLGSDRAESGERLAMYEVNPIYDSANG